MLLTTLSRRLRREDEGAAMAAVVGLMGVGVILTAVISTTIVSSVSYTTLTRNGVQSQAAAEAGIAEARAGLLEGTCASNGGVYESAPNTDPRYEATIWVEFGSTWTRACPTTTAQRVKILSSGWAQTTNQTGASGFDESNLEAVLSSVESSGGLVPSGPAIYAYNATGFTGSGTLVAVDGSSPSVLIREGNVTCSGASAGEADWVVNNGSLSISGSCNIAGNAWASGAASLSGGVRVGGNLVANSISVSGSSVIGRNAWSTTSTTLSGGGTRIGGNASQQQLRLNSSTRIDGNAWTLGDTYMDWDSRIVGNLTTRTRTGPSGTVGSQTIVPSGPSASPYLTPPRPFVPDWVDYAFDPSDWEGFTLATISGSCNYSSYTTAISAIGDRPGIIDARGCTNGVNPSSYQKVALRGDLAIIANRFDLGGSAGFTSTNAARLWLITPDTVDNNLPTCSSGQRFDIGGSFSFTSNISVMIYTPCDADIASGLNFKGQLFAGLASLSGAARLAYTAVGLPGVNLSTGEESGGSATEADREMLWIRNVADAG